MIIQFHENFNSKREDYGGIAWVKAFFGGFRLVLRILEIEVILKSA